MAGIGENPQEKEALVDKSGPRDPVMPAHSEMTQASSIFRREGNFSASNILSSPFT